tara:strand:+ start:97 stop:375 length:279 start_codon:yes stop_codon:yes gene_type:complete
MSNLHTFTTETEVGNLEFKGTPVAENFDYKTFALDNGFFNTIVDSIDNTEKYGGVGFFVAKNFSDDSDVSWCLKKTLEVLFINGLPVMYRFC